MDPSKSGDTKDRVDPYCVVKFGEHKEKTEVKKNCYNPEWNQEIRMPTYVSGTVCTI